MESVAQALEAADAIDECGMVTADSLTNLGLTEVQQCEMEFHLGPGPWHIESLVTLVPSSETSMSFTQAPHGVPHEFHSIIQCASRFSTRPGVSEELEDLEDAFKNAESILGQTRMSIFENVFKSLSKDTLASAQNKSVLSLFNYLLKSIAVLIEASNELVAKNREEEVAICTLKKSLDRENHIKERVCSQEEQELDELQEKLEASALELERLQKMVRGQQTQIEESMEAASETHIIVAEKERLTEQLERATNHIRSLQSEKTELGQKYLDKEEQALAMIRTCQGRLKEAELNKSEALKERDSAYEKISLLETVSLKPRVEKGTSPPQASKSPRYISTESTRHPLSNEKDSLMYTDYSGSLLNFSASTPLLTSSMLDNDTPLIARHDEAVSPSRVPLLSLRDSRSLSKQLETANMNLTLSPCYSMSSLPRSYRSGSPTHRLANTPSQPSLHGSPQAALRKRQEDGESTRRPVFLSSQRFPMYSAL
eukprot:Platyproteum_vivax@DN5999_c0_g1_i1.p1